MVPTMRNFWPHEPFILLNTVREATLCLVVHYTAAFKRDGLANNAS